MKIAVIGYGRVGSRTVAALLERGHEISLIDKEATRLSRAAQLEGVELTQGNGIDIDVQREAVANTLANAFRNGVAGRVSGDMVDLYNYVPPERYDLIVASLYQMPVDPLGQITGHRPVDFWGRSLFDHLIGLLPELLADGGLAYVMQISILGQVRTAELFEKVELDSRIIDYAFFHFSPVFYENIEQIKRVEQLSDAYHLKLGEDDVMVMYLLEVKRKKPGGD